MTDVVTYNDTMNAHDDMDISSELGQKDVDFDIEIDNFAEDDAQVEEEMQDDATIVAEQEDIELRSATDNNDYMLDDDLNEAHINGDAMVDHTTQNADDEELLDLSEEDDTGGSYGLSTTEQAHGDQVHHVSVQDELLLGSGEEKSAENVVPDNIYKAVTEDPGHSPQAETGDTSQVRITADEKPVDETAFTLDSVQTHSPVPELQGLTEAEGSDEHRNSPTENVDATANVENDDAQAETGSPHSQHSENAATFTGLHPTMVKYEEGWYTLFPSVEPAEGEQYFLEDENLVHGSIADLLQACRLALDEAVTDDYELELHVQDLDLYIIEDSPAAFSVSLAEILELFMQLHKNDGTETPPPLCVSIMAKPRFANRLSLLASLASDSKGMSSVPNFVPHQETDGDGAYTHEELEALAKSDESAKHDEATEAQQDEQEPSVQPAELHQDPPEVEQEHNHNEESADALSAPNPDEPAHEEVANEQSLKSEEANAEHAPALGNSNGGSEESQGFETVDDQGIEPYPIEFDESELTVGHEDPDSADHALAPAAKSDLAHAEVQAEKAVATDTPLAEAHPTAEKTEAPAVAEDDNDELDFDDDYDDALAINANRTKGTTTTPAKRGLDGATNDNDHTAKKARPST